jgi:RIO kinase 1
MSFEDDRFIDLTRPSFTRGQLAAAEQHMIRREFASTVEDVLGKINDGKEATVYLCRAHPHAGVGELVAAKIYRARKFRAFANDASYTNPDRLRDRRFAKMLKKRKRRGREAAHHRWIDHEWQVLETLHEAGASVPQPHSSCDFGFLMEFIGVDTTPAPKLAEVRLAPTDAADAFAQIVRDVEILLDCGFVHGDLSAFNVLYLHGRTRLIDLPQAMAIDDAPDPWSLLLRDLTNVCDHFRRRGHDVDALDLALRLWQRR